MKNMLIGIFVTVALAIIIFGLMFLHPYVGNKGQILHVRFSDIEKVTIGTRVTFAGKPVGEVVAIREIPSVNLGRKQINGEIYVYELDLAVDSSVIIFNSDAILLRTSGLLGEKLVEINPQPPMAGQKLRIVNKQILYAEQVSTVEETLKELKDVAEKVTDTLQSITGAFDELKERKVWENVADVMVNLKNVSDRFAKSWDTVDTSLKFINDTASNAAQISIDIKEGKGTMGRLITRDDLYLQTTALLSKGETVMDDINHFGILFHLDKGWQRLRARRMNLLMKLQTPQEFRNYFNDEVDQISTSLARVDMVLNASEQQCMCGELLEDKEFTKVFAELLRRVVTLEEELKMYNTQLVEPVIKKTELCN